MKKLEEFETLLDAQEYFFEEYKLIHSDTMTAVLKDLGLLSIINDVSNDEVHPARETCLATMIRIKANSEFNFDPSKTIGSGNIQAINDLANITLTEHKAKLENLLLICDSIAKSEIKPFKNATKHDFELAKGTIGRVEVTPVNGYLVINTTKDCEKHNPQIYIKIGDSFVRKAGFRNVEKQDQYVAEVPRNFTSFWVDNSYGAVS